MKLSKAEKQLLEVASSSSIGLMQVNHYAQAMLYVSSLIDKGLLLMSLNNKLPFCGAVSYYVLTKKGWEEAQKLKKISKAKKVKKLKDK